MLTNLFGHMMLSTLATISNSTAEFNEDGIGIEYQSSHAKAEKTLKPRAISLRPLKKILISNDPLDRDRFSVFKIEEDLYQDLMSKESRLRIYFSVRYPKYGLLTIENQEYGLDNGRYLITNNGGNPLGFLNIIGIKVEQ